ncbi:MAG: hypothetical protein H7Z40_07975 [Phycisphaerae bacterium]|nr:hypothetical protein [Gemmatimonadaceae bacterium]
MTRPSPATVATATRLLAASARHDREDAEAATTASEVLTKLQVGLGRWIGTASYNMLFSRALNMTRADFPVLEGLASSSATASELLTLMQAADRSTITSGLTALIATIIELLGRLIGHDVAIQLVEHLGPTDARSVVRTDLRET